MPIDERCVLGRIANPDDDAWVSGAMTELLFIGREQAWRPTLARLGDTGVRTVRSTTAAYPHNLGLIHDQPPVLFGAASFVPRIVERSQSLVPVRRHEKESLLGLRSPVTSRRPATRLCPDWPKRSTTRCGRSRRHSSR